MEKSAWINIYDDGKVTGSYPTKGMANDADRNYYAPQSKLVACIQIYWEEDQ